jgi:hypothetical protein
MFGIIPYIATPVALIAFIVAVIATIYRTRSRQNLDLIRSAPANERGNLVERLIEKEGLDKLIPGNLNRDQRYNLTMEILQQRVTRLKIIALCAVMIVFIGASLVSLLVLTDQPDPSSDGHTATLTTGRPPVIIDEYGAYENDLTPQEYTISPGTSWDTVAAEKLINLTKLSQVVLEGDQTAYEVRFSIKNATSENISLTISPSFFTVEDNQGLKAKQLYFCCTASGEILRSGQEREVVIFFEDLWVGGKYEPPSRPPTVQLIVRGLAPVTRAMWQAPLMLTAD